MKDLVAAVAVGKVGGRCLVDLNYDEEAFEGEGGSTDLPIAVLPNSGKITLMQMDGEVNKEDLDVCMDMAKRAALKIYEVQKKALKDRFAEGVKK
jgi:exosome complex component RRP41